MGKVGYRFLVIFFTWFGALIVFINFVGWSGAYINVSAGGDVDWTNSYFGFESVQTMIKALNTTMNGIEFLSVKKFPSHLNDLLDTIAFGIPQMLEKIGTDRYDVWGIAKFLFNILGGQPLYLIANLGICIAHILYYAMNFVAILLLAMGGRFNIPFDSPLTPTDYINAVRISVPILI